MLSLTELTYRYQKSWIQPCCGHFTAMPKRRKCVVLLLLFLLCHTFYFHEIFKKYFYVSSGNNFLLFFLWRPLGNCPVYPAPLNSTLLFENSHLVPSNVTFEHFTTNLCWASSVGSQRDATRICCWARRPQHGARSCRLISSANPTIALLLLIDGTDRRTESVNNSNIKRTVKVLYV